jgi:predicted RNase H-like nuclease (RuvC/YqgF family)
MTPEEEIAQLKKKIQEQEIEISALREALINIQVKKLQEQSNNSPGRVSALDMLQMFDRL